MDRFGGTINLTVPDITSRIKPASVNVVDISHMDEEAWMPLSLIT